MGGHVPDGHCPACLYYHVSLPPQKSILSILAQAVPSIIFTHLIPPWGRERERDGDGGRAGRRAGGQAGRQAAIIAIMGRPWQRWQGAYYGYLAMSTDIDISCLRGNLGPGLLVKT